MMQGNSFPTNPILVFETKKLFADAPQPTRLNTMDVHNVQTGI